MYNFRVPFRSSPAMAHQLERLLSALVGTPDFSCLLDRGCTTTVQRLGEPGHEPTFVHHDRVS